MDKKKDCAEKLRDIAEKFLLFASGEFPDCSSYFTDKVDEEVLGLLDIEKPRVMVYGIYNSGKSTLINALCKEEVAEVAAKPMTAEICEYDRGDYLLVDSPGVDAPIEHERVTEEYLHKCHVILFVISTKGLFEDRDNYKRLASLIAEGIPFIIVLNERWGGPRKECTDEERKQEELEHDQEVNIIQCKVIQNLIKESGDANIADKYEVVTLNAKKAVNGLQKQKPQLYEKSKVSFLDKRITQLLQNDASIGTLFKQPISNLHACMSEAEKLITQSIRGDSSEEFSKGFDTFAKKRENILQELRIMAKQAVNSRLEELANAYAVGDADLFETVANTAFGEIEDIYQSSVTELCAYAKRNFKSCELELDTVSNLRFDLKGMHGSRMPQEDGQDFYDDWDDSSFADTTAEKWSIFDLFKSQKKREQEKFERLEREAAIQNERAQYQVQETIRKKQEARQMAHYDLDGLYRVFSRSVTDGMGKKYQDIVAQVQEYESMDKQKQEEGKRQMKQLNELRNMLLRAEDTLG